MKRKIALIISIAVFSALSDFSVRAEDVTDCALKAGRRWVVEELYTWMTNGGGHRNDTTEYVIVGDTIYSGLACKLMQWEPVNYTIQESSDGPTPEFLGYEENGKVYYQYPYSANQNYKFDFQWEINADLGTQYKNGYRIDKILEIETCDRARRVLLIRGNVQIWGAEHPSVWVEGIGPIDGDILEKTPRPSDGSSVHYRVLECWDGDKKIFDYNEFVPRLMATAFIGNIETDSNTEDDTTVYDIQGRVVSYPCKGHIYIVNGRKILW